MLLIHNVLALIQSKTRYEQVQKNVLLISNGLHLQCNKGFLALQMDYFCNAKGLQLESKEALNEDWGSILR